MWPFRKRRSPPAAEATREQIIAAFEPWTLACAVGSMNGTIYGNNRRGWLTFDRWLFAVKKTDWPVPLPAAIEALRSYAETNRHRNMEEVFYDEEAKRRGKS